VINHMIAHKVDTEQASAHLDDENSIIYIVYYGILTSEGPKIVYSWLGELFEEIDINSINGQIFDFRQVEEFAQENLKTARRTSNRMNMQIDTSHIPVALLISDPYHQEILHSSMRISPEHSRKKIVWSEEEALAFFEQWHKEHS